MGDPNAEEPTPIPFTKLRRLDNNKRVNQTLEILCTLISREPINSTLDKKETNKLNHSWLDVSCPFIWFEFGLLLWPWC